MPTFIINTDTLIALQPYTGASTVQTVLENTLFQVIGISYAQQFGSTDFFDAAGDYLAAVVENRAVPMKRQIQNHAAGLLDAGVTAPGGKQVTANQVSIDTLTVAATLTAAQMGPLSMRAVDGTRWPINTPARATTVLNAINARVSAVNGARDTAVANFQALTLQQKRDFQFSSIVWP